MFSNFSPDRVVQPDSLSFEDRHFLPQVTGPFFFFFFGDRLFVILIGQLDSGD